jgi:hypothetical protein
MDPEKAKRYDRAGSEYRSTYYRAHNALEAMRKRKAAEAKEGSSDDVGGAGAGAGNAGAPVEPEINPQAWRRMIAPEPEKAPVGVTEVVAAEPDRVATIDSEYGSQNEPRNGRNGVSGAWPEPGRPDAGGTATITVGAIVPDGSRRAGLANDDGALRAPYNDNTMSPGLTP